MLKLSDKQFKELVAEAIDAVPPAYGRHLDNVAFIIEDEPSEQQRRQLRLLENQSLFGLYEGLPLPARGGVPKLLPDKITIFKNPALAASRDLEELKAGLKHTVWHEVAHYFGLDHRRISELENG